MDRVSFIGSVSGIDHPQMIVTFFDHFIALKKIVEDSGFVKVLNSTENTISFSIEFKEVSFKDQALAVINALGAIIVIYGRPITINTEILTDRTIGIHLS